MFICLYAYIYIYIYIYIHVCVCVFGCYINTVCVCEWEYKRFHPSTCYKNGCGCVEACGRRRERDGGRVRESLYL